MLFRTAANAGPVGTVGVLLLAAGAILAPAAAGHAAQDVVHAAVAAVGGFTRTAPAPLALLPLLAVVGILVVVAMIGVVAAAVAAAAVILEGRQRERARRGDGAAGQDDQGAGGGRREEAQHGTSRIHFSPP